MDALTIEFYNKNSKQLFKKYNNASPEYINLFEKLFIPGGKILDIGAGSGRDMNVLQQLGFKVSGIEPSNKLIEQINTNYPDLKDIRNESLPDTTFKYNSFDGIISIATLQHIPDDKLNNSINKIHSILKPDGILIISIPTKYPNITNNRDENNRDENNRLFIVRIKNEYLNLLKQKGFKLIYEQATDNDALDRLGIEWTTLVLKK